MLDTHRGVRFLVEMRHRCLAGSACHHDGWLRKPWHVGNILSPIKRALYVIGKAASNVVKNERSTFTNTSDRKPGVGFRDLLNFYGPCSRRCRQNISLGTCWRSD